MKKHKRTKEELLTILRANHLRTILSTQRATKKLKRYYLALDKQTPEIIEI
jgi:lysophospholipid acyltransferase (LPLAT)-like uncharacterized protein